MSKFMRKDYWNFWLSLFFLGVLRVFCIILFLFFIWDVGFRLDFCGFFI